MVANNLPKRVAIYLHTIFNGGVERVIFALSGAMIERQIKVDIVVNCSGFSPMLAEVPVGATLVDLRCDQFRSRLPKLLTYLKSSHPDCLLSAGHFSNEIAILAKLFSKSGVRVVVSEHTSLGTELNSLPGFSVRRIAIPAICRLLYPLADGIIAVSDGVRDDSTKLFRLNGRLCQTIYNPLDRNRIIQLSEESIDHPWFLTGSDPIVIGIGRLEKQKDFHNLIGAFVEVRKRFDAKLAIFGEGSERQALTALIDSLGIANHTWLPGFIPNPYPYLKRASVFALSSEWEGLPTALIEALALGVPVVSTDCPSGPSEILASGKYGIIVPMKDSAALARGILKVLDGHRPNVPEQALERYAVDAVVDRYLNLMSSRAQLSTEG
jgi:glycosyltransferase involved in cell wall biosynthesis